jgi:NADAR domain
VALLSTEERMLYKVASRDDIWGIRKNEKQPWKWGKTETWGQNRWGKALMVVRERLRMEDEEKGRKIWILSKLGANLGWVILVEKSSIPSLKL